MMQPHKVQLSSTGLDWRSLLSVMFTSRNDFTSVLTVCLPILSWEAAYLWSWNTEHHTETSVLAFCTGSLEIPMPYCGQYTLLYWEADWKLSSLRVKKSNYGQKWIELFLGMSKLCLFLFFIFFYHNFASFFLLNSESLCLLLCYLCILFLIDYVTNMYLNSWSHQSPFSVCRNEKGIIFGLNFAVSTPAFQIGKLWNCCLRLHLPLSLNITFNNFNQIRR